MSEEMKSTFIDIYERMTKTHDFGGYSTLVEYANGEYGLTINELLQGLTEIARAIQ